MRHSLRGYFAALLFGACAVACAAEPKLTLNKGDHITLIGNALAERMQHDGYLETMLHARFPELDLVIRNLGYSGDELTVRNRVEGFSDANLAQKGRPADVFDAQNRWLARCQTDVVLAFFGFNESFAGAAGVAKFKTDLAAHIKNLQAQNFNGKGAPKLVYFSPIAFENLKSPNLPDGAEHNARLKMYADAMKEVCAASETMFVDLFTPTFGDHKPALTINGVHLTSGGNKLVAETIVGALIGELRKYDEKLRQAVIEKNEIWFSRYRPTDDYNIFGGRSSLAYENGPGKGQISNYQVLIREMEVLEVMTANREKRAWAIARGGDLKVDDDNTPPFIEVKTNKPGKKADGSYDFLSGEDAIGRMKLGKNLKINLFASEEQFPELADPVQMAFDAKGRLWVAAWPTYPHWKPKTPMNDKLLILEDTNGDGKADKCTVFAGDLHDPTGFEFWNGGVIVAQAPDLMFLKDTNGDDKADVRERLLHGLSSGDTHHTANSFVIDPGGGLYWGEGVFHRSQIESIYGPVRNIDACIWRFDLRTWRVERYIPHAFANPHGNVIDYWGQQFVHDGTGANPYHATLFSGYLDYPAQHPSPPQLYRQTSRPLPGTEILSSKHFPEEYQGNLLVADVINTQGILRYKIAPDGASFQATALEPIVLRGNPEQKIPGDPNFRPADVEMGPDGAIYFLDWHKPLIGHMQHHLRDPNRDQVHGRVYRITYEGRPLVTPAKIAGEPIEKLLDLLKDSDDRTRNRARLELSGRNSAEVVAAAQKWAANLDRNDPAYEHHMMEALWVHQANDVVNMELLQRMLRSPDPNARAAATRVLCVQRERVKDPLYLLRTQAEDEHPLVRLEAVRACSFFKTAEAAEVALLSLKRPSDKYLSYTLGETMKQLKPLWSAALERGESIVKNNPAAANYVLDNVPTAKLLKLERTEAIYAALLGRHDASDADRVEAVDALARQYASNATTELINAMDRADKADTGHAAHIVGDLARLLLARPAKELSADRERIRQHAVRGKSTELRAAAYAAWMMAEGSAETAYAEASKTKDRLADFLEGVRYIKDATLQDALYARVRPLMFALPENLAADEKPAAKSVGLQVKVYQFNPLGAALEKFNNRKPDVTATVDKIIVNLPQVKDPHVVGLVFSGNLYVAKAGKNTFYLASDDGSCMYIDGKKVIDNDGLHGMSEKETSLNLPGGSHPIIITYWNNSGGFGLDANWSGPDFARRPLAGDISGGPAGGSVQDAAIRAVATIPGHEAEEFADFAKLIGDPQRRAAAVSAMRGVPKKGWSADLAPRIVDTILAYLTSQPASERTSAASVDALNLGKDLAALLPADQAGPLKARLQTLNVDVVVIRPVHHMMLYDHKRFYVEAGKPVEIIFDNTDVMPHNFVIVKPGALTEVGLAAEALGAAGAAKDSIPDSDKVLWHTKLLLPGTQERLVFTAPKEVGEFPYICTFPGHYLVMNGIMEVVKEKSAAQVPEIVSMQQMSEGPQRAFVKMWETKDLDAEFAQPLQGRSAARGKQMFTAAGCARCHAMKGEGGKIAPELSEVSKKFKGKDLLKQIIEPSAVIDDKFRNWQLALKDGRRITGMVVKEDDTTLELNTNPLAADGIVKVVKSDIQRRAPSPLSPMPTGMLVTLSKEEILDLVDWLEKGGGGGGGEKALK